MSKTLENDIDYIKTLAVAGGKGPLGNGAPLFWAGVLFGAASFGQYLMVMGIIPPTPARAAFLWLGASALYGIFGLVFRFLTPRTQSNSGKASSLAWSGVALAVLALLVSVSIISARLDTFEPMSWLIAPIVLAIYGMGWWVSAGMSQRGWLRLVSFGCFVAAPLISLLAGRPEQLLAYAACLWLLAALPGFILMRTEKA